MSVPDRNERAQQRRRREARARKVLTAASVLSLTAGTATIYAANAGSSEADQLTPTPFAVLKPVFIPDPTATTIPPTPTPTTEPAWNEDKDEGGEEYDDSGDYEDDEDESRGSTSLPNVTVPSTSTSESSPTPTPETPQIVVEQPSSHSRSHSTPG